MHLSDYRLSLVAMVMCLVACGEDAPPAKVEPPALPALTEDDFEESRGYELEVQAARLRGDRKRQQMQDASVVMSSGEPSQMVQHDDYQQTRVSFPQDVASEAVSRRLLITADMRISAITEDAIHSQIGGRVILVLDKGILNPMGETLLPAFTRVICGYTPLNKVGQSRLPLMCTRAIRPDGASVALTQSRGADMTGRAGLIGKVDNRSFVKYGGALFIAGISAWANHGQQQSSTFHNPLRDQLALESVRTSQQLIKEQFDMRPSMTIAAGSRVQLTPSQDIQMEAIYHEDD